MVTNVEDLASYWPNAVNALCSLCFVAYRL